MSDMGDESFLEVDRLDRRRRANRAAVSGSYMTEPELRDYAETLILSHATDVEYLSILEMAEEFSDREYIEDEDAEAVADLIQKARVSVHFD